MRQIALTAAVACLFMQPAWAVFDLQITEIWPGNEPGSNLTADWFEVTNFGDMAWEAATHGNLWYDDVSADIGDVDQIFGIDSIAPGESVVLVDGYNGPPGESLFTLIWIDLWDDVVSPLPQVGSFNGAGLGQGGDAVALFLDSDLSGSVDDTELIDLEEFPNAISTGGQSFDVVTQSFSVAGVNGAVATLTLNDENQPAVGSPGSVVPEPTALALMGMGLAGLGLRRKR